MFIMVVYVFLDQVSGKHKTIHQADRHTTTRAEQNNDPVLWKPDKSDAIGINAMRPRQNGGHFADDISSAFFFMKVFEFRLKSGSN